MSTEALERIKEQLAAQYEIMDQLRDSINSAIVEAQAELPYPPIDERIHSNAETGLAWKYIGGKYQVVVAQRHWPLLTRHIEVTTRFNSAKSDMTVGSVRVTARRSDDGVVRNGGYKSPLGRVVLQLEGRWTEGMQVDHRDKNPLNCHPSNVEAVTASENSRRKYGPPLPPLTEQEQEDQRRAVRDGKQLTFSLELPAPVQLPLPLDEPTNDHANS